MKPILVSPFYDQHEKSNIDPTWVLDHVAKRLGLSFFQTSFKTCEGLQDLITETYRLLGARCPDFAIQLYKTDGENESPLAEPNEGLQVEMSPTEHDKEPQAESPPAEPPKAADAQRDDVRLKDSCGEKIRPKPPSTASAVLSCCGCPLTVVYRSSVDGVKRRINQLLANLSGRGRLRTRARAFSGGTEWRDSMTPLLEKPV
ncbi:uncharacterized protein B0I36DRAFT_340459 [Microdochium trichocladiopsis]|uniref:Uncharacterized protein n=1 Tax=Microdochium trichocladiopsis TaxID=1682393 RepID=A0A9P8XRY9_9PEZI|nr:uncharacterized protein B0I36DRAFT_340459 [Microdochium trichocladiopsis]KAH7012052.1 hypothetical protein B0I36DRAFT_340459 [Microdochium trichocladiopsis]